MLLVAVEDGSRGRELRPRAVSELEALTPGKRESCKRTKLQPHPPAVSELKALTPGK